jgi:hypothetical protein
MVRYVTCSKFVTSRGPRTGLTKWSTRPAFIAAVVILGTAIFALVIPLRANGQPGAPPTVEFYLLSGAESGEINVQCRIYPTGRCVLSPQQIHLEIHDLDGKNVRSNARFIYWPPAARPVMETHVSLGFKLQQGDLAAGMYHVVAPVPEQPGATVRHEARITSLTFYVPQARSAEPALRIGQQFIALPRDSVLDTFGRVPQIAAVTSGSPSFGSIYTLTSVTNRTGSTVVKLQTDPFEKLELQTTGDVNSLGNLIPIVDDPGLRLLRAKYEGHLVWGRGGIAMLCATDSLIGVSGLVSLRIKRIVRLYGESSLVLGYDGRFGLDSEESYADIDPVVVLFDTPPKPGDTITDPQDNFHASQAADCATLYNTKADAWDVERQYSLIAPNVAHPNWSQETFDAIRHQIVIQGMNHDSVAWARGYPSIWGTRDELDALSAWKYQDLKPFHYWVYFKEGKVVKFGPDGHLP